MGNSLHQAIAIESPLLIVGVINAYCALLAERAGFKALYLSGSGVATAAHGLPDLGVTTLNDVAEEARRITGVTDLPLLVDIDTGWGGTLMIRRAIQTLERAGVAAVHIEDQVATKRCGHRPGKELVDVEEMCARIRAAVEARSNPQFVIMARTDSLAVEGFDAAVARSKAYKDAGADMLFPEAFTQLDQYLQIREAVGLPILANITEFGKTPLFASNELADHSVDMVLYPLSAARAMWKAADSVFQAIRAEGCQEGVLELMQTRDEMYEVLGYHEQEKL